MALVGPVPIAAGQHGPGTPPGQLADAGLGLGRPDDPDAFDLTKVDLFHTLGASVDGHLVKGELVRVPLENLARPPGSFFCVFSKNSISAKARKLNFFLETRFQK